MSLRTSTSPTHTLIIGEVAQAHDGSLGMAHAFVDAIADAGADAVKFQTHIAAAESTPAEPWRARFSRQDDSRYEYWERMEFTEPQWLGLREHAAERGLLFLSSPFSPDAVELLRRVGVDAWKVASGEVGNLDMIRDMARDGREVLLSSGMSGWEELETAVEVCRGEGAPVAVLQCNTAYPCPPEKVGLNVLREMAERFSCPVGLSDHSGTIFPAIAAVTLGAAVVEVHVTLSRNAFGPDVVASVTDHELAELVRGVRYVEEALAHPVDKDAEAAALGDMRSIFTKSIVARRAMPEGHVLTPDDLAAKKPGTGIPAHRAGALTGARLLRAVDADELLNWDDVHMDDGLPDSGDAATAADRTGPVEGARVR
jgi:N,N'-diacetyllegionaminate synthase